MMTGADGIALSCDGDALYYCPLSGRMLYSILQEIYLKQLKKTN